MSKVKEQVKAKVSDDERCPAGKVKAKVKVKKDSPLTALQAIKPLSIIH